MLRKDECNIVAKVTRLWATTLMSLERVSLRCPGLGGVSSIRLSSRTGTRSRATSLVFDAGESQW